MEELIPLILIFVVSSIVSSLKKNQKAAEAQRRHAAATARMQTAPRQVQPQPTAVPVMSFGDVPGQVIAPTVHPHVTPDCSTHDVPGSLGITSLEGKDPCHEEQLVSLRAPEEPVLQAQGGLTFDWTGSNMVKAIVMQEVLTRPAQRRAR